MGETKQKSTERTLSPAYATIVQQVKDRPLTAGQALESLRCILNHARFEYLEAARAYETYCAEGRRVNGDRLAEVMQKAGVCKKQLQQAETLRTIAEATGDPELVAQHESMIEQLRAVYGEIMQQGERLCKASTSSEELLEALQNADKNWRRVKIDVNIAASQIRRALNSAASVLRQYETNARMEIWSDVEIPRELRFSVLRDRW